MTAFSAVRPSAIKLKTVTRFPARVDGGTAISVEKENGVYTVGLDISQLQETAIFDPDVAELAIWNPETDVWNRTSLTDFVNTSVSTPTFDSISPTTTRGDLIFRNATTNTRLAAGTSGYHLQAAGAAADPVWAGFLQDGGGAATRTWQDKARDFVSVKDFGAVADGSVSVSETGTDARSAFAAAAAAFGSILVPPGNYRIASNLTLTKEFHFAPDAVICPDTGVTVTFSNVVHAGPSWRIFGDNGTILGIRRVHPEWWGATRSGTAHDDAPMFQKAQNCMEAGITSAGGEMCLSLSAGDYGIGSQVVCTPNIASKIQWIGQGGVAGSRLIALASWTGANGVLKLKADTVNSSASSCYFSGFRIIPQTAGSGSTTGIIIGADATTLQGGVNQSALFEDVGTYDFSVGWLIRNARLFQFRRCNAWVPTVVSGKCLAIVSSAADEFTGDLDFYSCQLVANATSSIALDIGSSGATTAHVAGVRFIAHIMYSGPANIVATTAGKISDIWFSSGWQYDVVVGDGFVIGADGAGSSVWNLNFNDGYWAGGLVGTFPAFNVFTSSSGKVTGINISDNFFIQGIGDVITLNGVNGAQVCRNRFIDCNGGDMIQFSSSFSVIINENIIQRKDTTNNAATLVNHAGSADYYSIRSNMSSGFLTGPVVSDASPGTNNIVDGNF